MPKASVRAGVPVHQNAKRPASQAVWQGFQETLAQPESRSAISALVKTTLLIGALWEYVWLWHTKYYSHRYPELPLSIAWSLLTVIGGVTFLQFGWSAVLKFRHARLRALEAQITRRLTELLAAYISDGDNEAQRPLPSPATPFNSFSLEDELNRYAEHSVTIFEACITSALLSTRGVAHERLCDLPAMAILRDRWIDSLHKRDARDRRYAVEHLALLRDPQATMALEYSLEDRHEGVVAAAIRGLLRVPGYSDRDALIRSLPQRPYLVRVLTAGEFPEETPSQIMARPSKPQLEQPLSLRHQQLRLRAQALDEAIRRRRGAHAGRVHCAVLASSGAEGRDLLRLMAATGKAGDAPAEALGGVLAAAARGGRT